MKNVMKICAKCLEAKCACEFYRKHFPEEWAVRDALGYAPPTELIPVYATKPVE